MSLRWSQAWRSAATGDDGFWRSAWPGDHFRTGAGPELADALLTLLGRLDECMSSATELEVIDIGAGDATLLTCLDERIAHGPLAGRVRLSGIDLRTPGDLPGHIEWIAGEAPEALLRARPDGVRGLIVANEWLDEVPCDVVEVDPEGVIRYVDVDPRTGRETLGATVDPSSIDGTWLRNWWPVHEVGQRAEIGANRDDAWRAVCSCVSEGMALAIDYDAKDRPWAGTLRGYRDGALVAAIPDGSCGITSHVLLESCAAVTRPPGRIVDQRSALRDLGMDARLPDPASLGEREYLEALQRAGRMRTLTDPRGLGAFGWLQYQPT